MAVERGGPSSETLVNRQTEGTGSRSGELIRESSQQRKTSHRRSSRRRRRTHRGIWSEGRIARLDQLMRWSSALVILLCVLSRGGTEAWSWPGAGIILSLMLGLWGLRCFGAGRITVRLHLALVIIPILAVVGFLQTINWQPLVEMLSPAAAADWKATADLGVPIQGYSFSLLPSQTMREVSRLLMLGVFLFLVLQCHRSKRDLVQLAAVILAATLLSALVGAMRLWGDIQLFDWQGPLYAPTMLGTFANRGQYAMLAVLTLPIGLGLLIATGAAHQSVRDRGKSRSQTLSLVLSEQRHIIYAVLVPIILFCSLAMVLTYSRAGVAAFFLAVGCLAAYGLIKGGARGWVLLAVLLVIIAVLLGSYYGLEPLSRRLHTLMSGQERSLVSRLDFWGVALKLILSHPWAGIGLGAFRYVSPQFESGIAVNRLAFHVHNDYLELICLVGIPIGLALVVLAGWVLWQTTRRLGRSNRSPVIWLGVGALAGLVGVAFLEFFDFGLQTPALALVFLAVLGLAIRCGDASRYHGSWNGYRSSAERVWQLTGARRRYCLAATITSVLALWMVFVPLAAGGWWLSQARLMVDRANAGSLEIKKPQAQHITKFCRQTLRWLPNEFWAVSTLADQEALVAVFTLQEQVARKLSLKLGRPVTTEDLFTPELVAEANQVAASLEPEERKEVMGHLQNTVSAYGRACGLAPTNGHALSQLAQSLLRRDEWSGVDWPRVMAIYQRARELYPHLGYVTFAVAQGTWQYGQWLRSQGRLGEAKREQDKGLELFRETLIQNPEGGEEVFETIWLQMRDPAILVSITPDLLVAQEKLYNFMFQYGQWEVCLAINRRMLEMNRSRADDDNTSHLSGFHFARRDMRPKEELALELTRRRAILLGLMGRWKKWRLAKMELQKVLDHTAAYYLDQAESFLREDRDQLATSLALEGLKTNPMSPRALLVRAETLAASNRGEMAWGELLAMVSTQTGASKELLVRALALVEELLNSDLPQLSSQFPVGKAVRVGLLTRLGRPQEALDALRRLSHLRALQEIPRWSQEHLLHLFQGLSLEQTGQIIPAAKSYFRCLVLSSSQLEACKHLAAICARSDTLQAVASSIQAGDERNQFVKRLAGARQLLGELESGPNLQIDFGGMIRLISQKVTPPVADALQGVKVTHYWQALRDWGASPPLVRVGYNNSSGSVFYDAYRLAGNRDDRTACLVGGIYVIHRVVAGLMLSPVKEETGTAAGSYYAQINAYGSGFLKERLPAPVPALLPAFQVREEKAQTLKQLEARP